MEKDPNGLALNEPGAKADAGKNRVAMVLRNFARALEQVAEIGTAGAKKYSDGGWLEVPDGIKRYADAGMRHQLKEWKGEVYDRDSGQLHAAHRAWNALAELELKLRYLEDAEQGEFYEGGCTTDEQCSNITHCGIFDGCLSGSDSGRG